MIGMYPFQFDLPTKIIFGEGVINKIGEVAINYGKKALLLTLNENSIKEKGFFQKVDSSCTAAGIELHPYFGVKSNPSMEHAIGVIETIKKEKPDVVIALGGGSVMDEAKFVAAAGMYGGDPWDLVCGKAPVLDSLPVIAIATIPATSSELNGTSVMSYQKITRKDAISSPVMRPKVAILDPELTYSVSLQRTAYSAADIISHLVEAYFGHNLDWAPFQDRYCQGSIRTIIDCVNRLMINSTDKDARAQMMWTASYAWSGFYPCGLGPWDAPIHILGHSLSNFYDTPHGAAMSVTILGTMKYFLETKTKKFADFAREVFQVNEKEDLKAARAGINMLESWFKKIGTPTNLAEAGIPLDAISKMAADALLTAKQWGSGERYSVEKIIDIFNYCV